MAEPARMNGERCYLKLIVEEIEKAYKPGDTFQKESMIYVNKKFRLTYGPYISDRNLKSRFKQLHKKYHEFSELLSLDGITWDIQNNTLDGDPNLLMEKKYFDGYYTGGEANFDIMCQVFESGVQFEF